MNTQAPKPTVLITGCSGLIGLRLMNSLQGDFQVVGLDLKAPEQLPEGARWIHCDLTDDESVKQNVSLALSDAKGPIASAIHLAAYYDFSGEPSDLYEQLTVEGTRRLLRALRDFPVEQFVFASSLLVMKSADDEDKGLTEASPLEAEWDYPESKLDAERVILMEQGEIPAVVLRIAGVFDELCRSLPISQQIRRIYEKELESHFFPGDPSRGQPFVHLNDLTDCLRKTIDQRRALRHHEVFLIAENDLMSYGELQDAIGRYLHGDQWSTLRVPKPVAKAGAWAKDKLTQEDQFIKPWMVDLADQHYPVEIAKAQEQLGWKPKYTLRQTLPDMLSNLQHDPERWYEVNGLKQPVDTLF